MFHFGRYSWSVAEYAALYKEWDELFGMEVFNRRDSSPQDRKTWDQLLTPHYLKNGSYLRPTRSYTLTLTLLEEG